MKLIYSTRALNDIRRLKAFLQEHAPAAAVATGEVILGAIEILDQHPLMGRPVSRSLRELVISRGRSGYVALYGVDDRSDEVFILAIRHQRESGYHQEDL